METISFELVVAGDPEEVFTVTHDRLPDLISDVGVVEHEDRSVNERSGDRTETVDIWELDVMKPIPSFLSVLISFEKILLKSTIRWDKRALDTEWEFSVPEREGLLESATGQADFHEHPDGTIIRLEGGFELHLSALSGIPKFVSNSLQGRQGTIAERIVRNYLPQVEAAIEEYCQ